MANFTPVLGDYTELKPFRFWCQKVLPLVYDDSLSYYELLCKVVDYLNKTMEDVDTLHTDIENLRTAYEQLQEYVNDYFDNLDVQEEINNKLDAMAQDGSLSALISPFIPDIVSAWLNEHVEPTSPVIDDTLSISGAGADAKKTGDAISTKYSATSAYKVGDYVIYNGTLYKCNTEITTGEAFNTNKWDAVNIAEELKEDEIAINKKLDIPVIITTLPVEIQNGYYTEDGFNASNEFICTKKSVTAGEIVLLTGSGNYFAFAYYFVDDNGNIIKQATAPMELTDYEMVVPTGATYVELNTTGLRVRTVGVKVKTYDYDFADDTKEAIEYLYKNKCDNGYEWTDQNLESINGIVSLEGNVVQGNVWTHCIYTISDLTNKRIRVTGADFSLAYPFVLFLNSSNNVIGHIHIQDNTAYENYEIPINTIPDGCTQILVNNDSRLTGNNKPYVYIGNIISLEELNDKIDDMSVDNYWRGKKIVWFGTSIPAGVVNAGESGGNGSYPMRLAELLGATVYNESVGSSCARAGNHNNVSETDPLGYSGMIATNLVLSLSLSSSEKTTLFSQWDSKWKNIIYGANDVDMSADKQNFYKSTSWDIKLAKYLTGGSVGPVDLYVFDHGHNDHGYPYNGWSDVSVEPPTNNQSNRTYFIGAMNFLIEKILSDNPKARIVFIGHYENDYHPPISVGQEKVASKWNYPLCKTWEKLGWTQNQVTYNGVTKTILNFWCPDGVHPSSDLTGSALQLYAEVLYPFMPECR